MLFLEAHKEKIGGTYRGDMSVDSKWDVHWQVSLYQQIVDLIEIIQQFEKVVFIVVPSNGN